MFVDSMTERLTIVGMVQLRGAMRGLAEHWWWSPADNNAELHKFHRSEPKQKMKVSIVLNISTVVLDCLARECCQCICHSGSSIRLVLDHLLTCMLLLGQLGCDNPVSLFFRVHIYHYQAYQLWITLCWCNADL